MKMAVIIYFTQFIDTEILRKRHIAHNLPDIANNLINREIFYIIIY